MIILSFFSILFSGCDFFKVKTFSEIEIGKTFWGSRDGYWEKFPQNYCMYVDLGSKTYLIRVDDENLYKEDSTLTYESAILEGHFIKGFFTSDYLVLCEERDNDDIVFLSFSFADEQVQYYTGVDEMREVLNLELFEWSPLCNTNEEIRVIDRPTFE